MIRIHIVYKMLLYYGKICLNLVYSILFSDDPTQDGKENKQSYKELLEGSSTEPARQDTEQTPKKTRHKKTRTLTRYSKMNGLLLAKKRKL